MWVTRPNSRSWVVVNGRSGKMALMSAVVYTPKRKKRRPGVWYSLGSTNKASFSRPVGREREGIIAYLFRHLEIRGKETLAQR